MNKETISLNTRLLAILLGCVLVLGIVVFFVHRIQIERQADIFLDHARKLKDSIDKQVDFDTKFKQVLKASGNYGKYSQFHPKNNDIVAERGLMLAKTAEDFAQAGRLHDAALLHNHGLYFLEKVLREEPERRELRRTVVQSLSALRRDKSAIDHIALLASVPSDEEGLRKLFDRYDLWQRATANSGMDKPNWREDVLADFLLPESKNVDHNRVTSWLKDDLWMALEDPELLVLFGKSQIQQNRPELGEKPLEKAIQKAPNNLDAYRMLADLLRRLDRGEDADYWMSEMVAVNPDSFEAIRMRGEYRMGLIRQSRREKGLGLAKNALSDAIQSIFKALEQTIDKADAAAPSSEAVKNLKKAFNLARQLKPKDDEAPTPDFRDQLIAAVENHHALSKDMPNAQKESEGARDGLVLAAHCELAAAQIDEEDAKGLHLANSLAYGTKAAKLFPSHAPTYLVLASVERELGHEDKAIEWLQRGCDVDGTRPAVMWQLASSLIAQKRLDEARQTIEKMSQKEVPEVFLMHLNAMLHYAEGNWLQAKEGFEEVLPQLSEWPQIAVRANLLIASCCEKLGLVDQQREMLMRAASQDMTSVGVLLKLAELEVESGQLDEAIEDYRLVLRLRNAPSFVYLALAKAMLTKNLRLPKMERNWGEVETVIKEAQKALPNSPNLAVLRAELLAARDKSDEASTLLVETLQWLHKEIKLLQDQHQIAVKEAETLTGLAKTKKLAEANHLQRKIREYKILNSTIWQTRVRLAERQKNWEEASRLISTVEQQAGDSPRMRFLKARNLAVRHGKSATAEIKKLLDGTETFTTSQQAWLWRNFAMLAYEIRDYSLANELCQRLLKVEPDNLELHKLRFQIASAQKNVEAMENILDQIHDIENEPSAFWYYAEAMRLMMLVDQGGDAKLLQRALKNLEQAGKKSPQWGQVDLLAGLIHERIGQVDQAIDAYLEAIDQGIVDTSMIRRVAQLLIRNNRLREADRMFRLLAEREPLLSDEMSREKRSVKAKLGNFDAALGPARKIAKTSNKAEDHIWLGQLLSVVGQRMRRQDRDKEADALLEEAENAFRAAVILKIDSPEPWVSLVQFFAQTRQIAKAEKTIAQARLKLPPAVVATALGQCYEVMQQPEKAMEQYENAVRSAPKDPLVADSAATFFYRTNQIAKAQSQLMRIIQGEVDSNKAQKMQARRRMAMIASEQGGQKNRRDAISWIDKNLAEEPESTTDQYLKAVIMAQDLTGKRRQDAIASLEKLISTQRNPDPEIQFTLAQLYLVDGNWREYKLRMEKLLKTYRDAPQYIASYAVALIDHNAYHEAEAMVAQLVKLAPDSARTIAIRSELAFQQRQYDRARRVWLDYLEGPSIEPSEKEKRLSMVANALENYAERFRAKKDSSQANTFSRQANDVYRRYVDLHPGRELLMASFLAKQKRLDEAIDLIDTLWESSDPQQIAVACFDVIDQKGASKAQLSRIDRILQKAAKQYPNAMVIQIAIAVTRTTQEQTEDAEKIYRAILQRSPDNPTVLNNLAVLLARHGIKLNEAASMIDRAIQQVGPTDNLLDSRAIVQLALNHPEKALEDLQKAIAKRPTPMRYFHQAEAYYASGQRKEAVQAFDRAVKMGLREEYLSGVELRKFKKLHMLLK